MVAIPRYVATPAEAAARIAGFIFGDGNPEHTDPQLGVTSLTALDTTNWTRSEIIRCANILGWVVGTDYRLPSNGNVIIRQSSIYTALGRPTTNSFYYYALAPVGSWTPTRVQLQAFMASVIETEGQAGSAPNSKVFDEARADDATHEYSLRPTNLVVALNTQSLQATQSGLSARVPSDNLDAFGMPLISAARYPGVTPANWPDGSPLPPDTTPPPVPTGLVSLDGLEQVSLSWATVAAGDLAGYRLYRNGVQIYQGTGSGFLDDALAPGVYTYRVTSYDTSNNESAQSDPTTGTSTVAPAQPTTPEPATSLSGIPSTTTVTLTWVPSVTADVVSYQVYRDVALIATVTGSSYVDTGLNDATNYSYRVVAVDSEGDLSASTAFISVTTLLASVAPPEVVVPTTIINQLGCASDYDLYIADRSGEILLRQLPFTRLSYNRVVDDTSRADIEVGSINGWFECCAALNGVRPYAYEAVIFREGQRVWTGPIIDVMYEGETASVNAEDKTSWLKVRVNHTALNYPEPGVDSSVIFNALIADAMQPDNVPGLVANATPTGIAAARSYPVNPPEIVYDSIMELARTSVDFTMVGPDMVAGSFVVPTPPIAYITDQSLAEPPEIEMLGTNYATRWLVTGDPDQSLIGVYGGIDAITGLVERVAQEDDIEDQPSLDQNARSRWELTSQLYISSIRLVLDSEAPLPFELAVPGAVIDLRLSDGCVSVAGEYRLREVNVKVDDSETVTITVEPVGTEIVS